MSDDFVDIKIPTYEKKHTHTVYNIKVTTNLTNWSVNKRFKSFDKLNQEIIKAVGPAKVGTLPVLPIKKVCCVLSLAYVHRVCHCKVSLIFSPHFLF